MRESSSKNEKIAKKLMLELLKNRGFQKLWHEAALDSATTSSNLQSPPSASHNNYNIEDDNIVAGSPSIDSITAAQVVEELSNNIILTIENFLRNCNLYLFYI